MNTLQPPMTARARGWFWGPRKESGLWLAPSPYYRLRIAWGWYLYLAVWRIRFRIETRP